MTETGPAAGAETGPATGGRPGQGFRIDGYRYAKVEALEGARAQAYAANARDASAAGGEAAARGHKVPASGARETFTAGSGEPAARDRTGGAAGAAGQERPSGQDRPVRPGGTGRPGSRNVPGSPNGVGSPKEPCDGPAEGVRWVALDAGEKGPRPRGPEDLRPGERFTTRDFVERLLASAFFRAQTTGHCVVPELEAKYASLARPWPKPMAEVLSRAGVRSLYTHQARAMDLVRAGEDVVVATPTASGKTLVYNLPYLERRLLDPDATALYLFPLKALAQDQKRTFERLTEHWPEHARPKVALYDGDTPTAERAKIRRDPPAVLVTNPDMLHLGILPNHANWTEFLASLSLIVLDEAHTYRGVFGAHMACVLRRLNRLCARYGAHPAHVLCTATVGNPGQLGRLLLDRAGDPEVVAESGAPRGRRHMFFMEPEASASTLAIALLKQALRLGLRTIVYCRSRRMTELVCLWVSRQSAKVAKRISAYRSGYLPEERREIEARMASGELLAVVSTSALELGIDIGSLDVCILVGYPGSVMATLQRGGRVGRKGQESCVVLVGGEDALDQYFVRNPREFFARPPENAMLNPDNPVILSRHLECAAAESPLVGDEPWMREEPARECVEELEKRGTLLRVEDGTALVAARGNPQRNVSLRGSGATFQIVDQKGRVIGSVDAHQAFRETHDGAVYIHHGRSYTIEKLDLAERLAHARPHSVRYHTNARTRKTTEILSASLTGTVFGMPVRYGRLRVTETVTGYERRDNGSRRLLDIMPLNLPPQVFETEGLWMAVPDDVRELVEGNWHHFMGSIHALEHVSIGLMPLMVMADRNDFGGISTPMHPQVGGPAVFVYDGLPGGAGLVGSAFSHLDELLVGVERTLAQCPCETGCPSCVQSPKCGSGNRPLDKAGCLLLVRTLLARRALGLTFTPCDIVYAADGSEIPAGGGENGGGAAPERAPGGAPSSDGGTQASTTTDADDGDGAFAAIDAGSSDDAVADPDAGPDRDFGAEPETGARAAYAPGAAKLSRTGAGTAPEAGRAACATGGSAACGRGAQDGYDPGTGELWDAVGDPRDGTWDGSWEEFPDEDRVSGPSEEAYFDLASGRLRDPRARADRDPAAGAGVAPGGRVLPSALPDNPTNVSGGRGRSSATSSLEGEGAGSRTRAGRGRASSGGGQIRGRGRRGSAYPDSFDDGFGDVTAPLSDDDIPDFDPVPDTFPDGGSFRVGAPEDGGYEGASFGGGYDDPPLADGGFPEDGYDVADGYRNGAPGGYPEGVPDGYRKDVSGGVPEGIPDGFAETSRDGFPEAFADDLRSGLKPGWATESDPDPVADPMPDQAYPGHGPYFNFSEGRIPGENLKSDFKFSTEKENKLREVDTDIEAADRSLPRSARTGTSERAEHPFGGARKTLNPGFGTPSGTRENPQSEGPSEPGFTTPSAARSDVRSGAQSEPRSGSGSEAFRGATSCARSGVRSEGRPGARSAVRSGAPSEAVDNPRPAPNRVPRPGRKTAPGTPTLPDEGTTRVASVRSLAELLGAGAPAVPGTSGGASGNSSGRASGKASSGEPGRGSVAGATRDTGGMDRNDAPEVMGRHVLLPGADPDVPSVWHLPETTARGLEDAVVETFRRTGGRRDVLNGPVVVFDVETRRSAAEVGGWGNAARMGVSVLVCHDGEKFLAFGQDELAGFFELCRTAGLVVGFNSFRFDYEVLRPFAPYDLRSLPGLDLLVEVRRRLNYRVSLDNLGQATLGMAKSGHGLEALEWWKQGRVEEITEYCRRDVAITRDLYLYGREHGYLCFTNKYGQVVRVPVEW